jgi:hypothetical protein
MGENAPARTDSAQQIGDIVCFGQVTVRVFRSRSAMLATVDSQHMIAAGVKMSGRGGADS